MEKRFTISALLAVLALPGAAPSLAAKPTACEARSDFLVRSDASLAPVRPTHCSTTTQTPPEFTWPPQKGRNTYEVTLTLPDGRKDTRETRNNWLLWDKALPPGDYSWRVDVRGEANHEGQPRRFTIAKGAEPFVVPPAWQILETAIAAPRPRTWSRDGARPVQAAKAGRSEEFRRLRVEVENKMPASTQPEPNSGSDNANYEATVAEQKRTLAAAFAYAVTKDPKYGGDALRRMLAQARWTTPKLDYKKNDMANRNVAWTLALAYDWIHGFIPEGQRAVILAAIKTRTQPMFEDVTSRLAGHPYDSHGNVTLTLVAAIGVLMAGEFPEANLWVREAVPLAIVWTSPWGGPDGGFANGSQQLFWDTGEHLPAWYVLRNAAGVDLAKKEWVRNLPRFMAYFVPPGAPSGVFGDGHEMRLAEVWGRIAKATARFVRTPLGLWYAGSHDKGEGSRIELMLSPVVERGSSRLPPGTPNAAAFPSVGWVAMHSRLDDPDRTSIYFKSSPYGSYNHSHGDQNGFVIHHRGERLAIASGYYDSYHSPHWRDWYKQTRAANAITFDGGKGQGFNGKQFAGEITRFEHTAGHDIATGRAAKAYGGELTRAERSIVYLRPDIVLVHDRLASATPRRWEWNIHAEDEMREAGAQAIELRNGRAVMCVEMVSGPGSAFEQTDQFTAPPRGDKPRQWHGRFTAASASAEAEFLAVMRIGQRCGEGGASASVKETPEGLRVVVAGRTVRFGEEGPKVEGGPGGRIAAADAGTVRR